MLFIILGIVYDCSIILSFFIFTSFANEIIAYTIAEMKPPSIGMPSGDCLAVEGIEPETFKPKERDLVLLTAVGLYQY